MKLMMLVNKDEHVEVKKIHMDEEYKTEYKEMFKWIEDILEEHPKTWSKYAGDKDEIDCIINMEIGELIEAKKTKDLHQLTKEYMHCAAAFLNGYLHALHEYEKHYPKK